MDAYEEGGRLEKGDAPLDDYDDMEYDENEKYDDMADELNRIMPHLLLGAEPTEVESVLGRNLLKEYGNIDKIKNKLASLERRQRKLSESRDGNVVRCCSTF